MTPLHRRSQERTIARVGVCAPPARVLARAQPWPSSLALDGTNVYWTTSDCDIAFMADSPQ